MFNIFNMIEYVRLNIEVAIIKSECRNVEINHYSKNYKQIIMKNEVK